MQLSSRFGQASPSLRSPIPLTDGQLRRVAPSIFADEPHESRSARYTYIPTGEVLGALRKEGFQPFMVCQTRTRDEGKREHTKHMMRLRHETQINGEEANEIILLCGGGPSVQIIGDLDDMEPFSAELEYQDWSARWEVYHSEDSDVLLRYARLILS